MSAKPRMSTDSSPGAVKLTNRQPIPLAILVCIPTFSYIRSIIVVTMVDVGWIIDVSSANLGTVRLSVFNLLDIRVGRAIMEVMFLGFRHGCKKRHEFLSPRDTRLPSRRP
jgi:hypothetical protein